MKINKLTVGYDALLRSPPPRLVCPRCAKEMFIVGISNEVLWCDYCKKCFEVHLRENSRLTEKELTGVCGFPQRKHSRKTHSS